MQNKLFINGQWRDAQSGKTFATIDPATKQEFHQVAAAQAADIDLAVQAASEAFAEGQGAWPQMSGTERAKILRKMGDEINRDIQRLAKLEVQDNGKPLPEAEWDIEDTAGCFHFYADLAEQQDQQREREVKLSDKRFTTKVIKEPIGVVGAIIPWNFPMLMAAWKVAPALAAGCCIVLKPSELTPVTALELGVIAEKCGLPAGVLNIVTGLGPDAGKPLSSHPQVDKLAFTGSVPTGTQVMMAAAQDIKAVSLELGGKSPMVIFDDVNIAEAVEWILFGIFWNKGEVCSATSRVLIHENIYEELTKRLIAEAQKIKIGQGLEEGVLLGPLVSESQYTKVLAAIQKAQGEGAKLLCGGKVPEGMEQGYYLEPTVFADVPTDSWIWQEEVFGPVLCIKSFKREEEAVQIANDSRFGLAAAVMSEDLDRAARVANAFRAGIIWVNCSQPTFTEAPWGGYKQSGIGRELGEWGYNNYLETKQVTSYARSEPWGWYIK